MSSGGSHHIAFSAPHKHGHSSRHVQIRTTKADDGESSTSPVRSGLLSQQRHSTSSSVLQNNPSNKIRNRRTSLPAACAVPNFAQFHKADLEQSRINEARGMLADLLADRELPGTVLSCLRAVHSLLNPVQAAAFGPLDMIGLPRIVDDPYSGEQLCLQNASKSRVGNIGFSTVTSATGLPTIVAEPSRARSCSFWKAHDDFNEAEDSSEEASPSNTPKKSSDGQIRAQIDNQLFNLAEIDRDPVLSQLHNWSFPIFDYFAQHQKGLLTRMAWRLFKQTNLMKVFKINQQKFVNFFHALESGYRDIPYHNRMHATDVLHSVYYLTHHPVTMLESTTSVNAEQEAKNDDEINTIVRQQSLASCMSALELMALFTAAAMHDYDHPGRTNAFLVATEDPKAILYNDRSVLENHHAASGWSLLSKTENYFIDHLDAAEAKRFRYTVLELILATDLKRHFEIIMDFNAKIKGDALDLDDETDRLLATMMVIKMGDINAPAKPRTLHLKWTNRILEEFYLQGDDEKSRGLSVSPYMDRTDPQVAKLQTSFISHMVFPLAQALEEAGILPSIKAEAPHETEPQDEDDDGELITYLKRNQTKWQSEIEPTESCNTENEDLEQSQPEMETITEQHEEEDEPQTLL